MKRIEIEKRAELEEKRIEKYYSNNEFNSKQVVCIIPKPNYFSVIDNLTHDALISLAFLKGKVVPYKEGMNVCDTPTKKRFKAELFTHCVEYCPECENEVLLETTFQKQICPVCGKVIYPCNLCGGYCQNPCPLKHKRIKR